MTRVVCCQGKSCCWVTENSEWNELNISRLTDVEHDSILPLWRVTVDLDASPVDVLSRLRSIATVSSTFSRWKTLAQPSDDVDVVDYAMTLPALDRTRRFHVIRYRNNLFYLLKYYITRIFIHQ